MCISRIYYSLNFEVFKKTTAVIKRNKKLYFPLHLFVKISTIILFLFILYSNMYLSEIDPKLIDDLDLADKLPPIFFFYFLQNNTTKTIC